MKRMFGLKQNTGASVEKKLNKPGQKMLLAPEKPCGGGVDPVTSSPSQGVDILAFGGFHPKYIT